MIGENAFETIRTVGNAFQYIDVVVAFFVVVVPALALLKTCIHISKEWNRYPVYRFGKFHSIRGPGLFLTFPVWETVDSPIDLRTQTTQIQAEDTLTKDGTPMVVLAVVIWNVNDPKRAKLEVAKYKKSVRLVSQASLRHAISSADFDDVISNREKMDETIQDILGPKVADWGITVESVQILDITLPEELQRAMSQKAQASRESAALITLSEAEIDIATNLVQAANTLGCEAIEIRRLNTWADMAREGQAATVFVPTNMGIIAGAPSNISAMTTA